MSGPARKTSSVKIVPIQPAENGAVRDPHSFQVPKLRETPKTETKLQSREIKVPITVVSKQKEPPIQTHIERKRDSDAREIPIQRPEVNTQPRKREQEVPVKREAPKPEVKEAPGVKKREPEARQVPVVRETAKPEVKVKEAPVVKKSEPEVKEMPAVKEVPVVKEVKKADVKKPEVKEVPVMKEPEIDKVCKVT